MPDPGSRSQLHSRVWPESEDRSKGVTLRARVLGLSESGDLVAASFGISPVHEDLRSTLEILREAAPFPCPDSFQSDSFPRHWEHCLGSVIATRGPERQASFFPAKIASNCGLAMVFRQRSALHSLSGDSPTPEAATNGCKAVSESLARVSLSWNRSHKIALRRQQNRADPALPQAGASVRRQEEDGRAEGVPLDFLGRSSAARRLWAVSGHLLRNSPSSVSVRSPSVNVRGSRRLLRRGRIGKGRDRHGGT